VSKKYSLQSRYSHYLPH